MLEETEDEPSREQIQHEGLGDIHGDIAVDNFVDRRSFALAARWDNGLLLAKPGGRSLVSPRVCRLRFT